MEDKATNTEMDKPLRSREQINQEYTNVCTLYGDLSFKIKNMEEHQVRLRQEAYEKKQGLDDLIKKMKELSQEQAAPVEEKPVEVS